MEYNHTFITTYNKPNAFKAYIMENLTWVTRIELDPLSNSVTLFSDTELSPLDLETATTTIDSYVDPESFLIFKQAYNNPMSTKFNTDESLIIDGKKVMQTFIFTKPILDNLILDSLKTVVEYNCPDTSLFDLQSGESITLQIYDITRDVEILNRTILLDEIETKWNGLLVGSDTVFRSAFFGGLQYALPDHDCVWQICVECSNTNFRVRLNSLQQLFYEIE